MLDWELLSRFSGRVQVTEDGCWLWTGSINAHGYGRFSTRRSDPPRSWLAHRWIYSSLISPIPPTEELDHECHNRAVSCRGGPTCSHRRCVNPDHLSPVTGAENVRRSLVTASREARREAGRRAGAVTGAQNRAKTHCTRGHPYDEVNTYRMPSGGRACRECQRTHSREWQAARRAEGGGRYR